MFRGGGKLILACLFVLPTIAHAQDPLVLWHAYDDREAEALQQVLEAFEREHDEHVQAMRLPFGVLSSRLESAVPSGNGPDLFIDAHERLGRYLARGLVQPLAGATEGLEPAHLEALTRDGQLYGLPLSAKALALYVNTDLAVPREIELDALCEGVEAQWCLAVDGEDAYFAAPIFHAYGASLYTADRYGLAHDGVADPGAIRALEHLRRLFDDGLVPPEPSSDLVARLFGAGDAAFAISGPWFASSLPDALNFRVVPLPTIDGAAMRPFVTVEAVFQASTRDPERVARLSDYLAGPKGALIRARVGRQVVSHVDTWNQFEPDASLLAFREAARGGVLMSSDLRMSQTFEPTTRAIRAVVRRGVTPAAALVDAERRFDDAVRPPPPTREGSTDLLFIGLLLLIIAGIAVHRARGSDVSLRASIPAYRYLVASFVAVLVLVIAPLLVGAAMSLFATDGSEFHYVGLSHYVDILTARGRPLFSEGSFWRVLAVTVLWTVLNLFLHVAIGVALALMLHRPGLRGRSLYRVLLILPWAVPNYVTALSWKGMFHSQYGAINALLEAVGAEPVAWFSRFSTAFAANITTNVWLGFPFMMVVALGALSAIPKELYEAARVDGASWWQQQRLITLPLLWPSLIPAVAMGAVWTFNMFNVVFLVSGGEPGGSTEILVSEAYRWAFTRGARYGYAAAYAVLIFVVLWLATRTKGVSRAMS